MNVSDQIHFRPLSIDDWDAYRGLRLRSIDEWPQAIYPTHAEESSRSRGQIQAKIEETPCQVIFGAYAGATLVGIAGCRREPLVQVAHKGILWGVYMHPAHRRGGVTRRLLAALFDHVRAAGVTQIHLNVNTENAGATGLYRSLGFDIYGREPRAMRIGQTFYDEYLMVLML